MEDWLRPISCRGQWARTTSRVLGEDDSGRCGGWEGLVDLEACEAKGEGERRRIVGLARMLALEKRKVGFDFGVGELMRDW